MRSTTTSYNRNPSDDRRSGSDARNITVVMATYNGEKFLRMQLDSILAQTWPAYEIIIQDDGSTDNTWDILTEYAGLHANVFIYRNEIRLGVNQNFISAFSRATGEFIAISDQDDVWDLEKLEKYIHEFDREEVLLVYADSWICDQDLNKKYVMKLPDFNLFESMWRGVAPGHSIMFRRSLLLSIQNIAEIDFIYDWLINLSAIANGQKKKINFPLTCWRRHNLTVTNLNFQPPVVYYEKPLLTTIRVISFLLKHKKHPDFKWQFENIYLILQNFRHTKEMNLLLDFLSYYKKETVSGMLMSSLLYFALRKDLPFRERIKALYFPIYKYHFYKRDGAGLRGA